MREWEAGDSVLVSERDGLQERVAWVEEHARVVPRPAEGLTMDAATERSERAVGRSSYCSAELGIHGETLYADDVGLRRIVLASGGRSFSTVTLVRGLAEEDRMSRDEYSRHALWLAQHRYFAVPMSEELICRAFRESGPGEVVEAPTVASSATTGIDSAAKIGASALKWMATNPVGISLGVATGAIVAAMSRRWGRRGAGVALARAVTEEFVLLPRQLATILKECRRAEQ